MNKLRTGAYARAVRRRRVETRTDGRAPQPSARLVRAVAAERAELERHRARLTTEADELRAALARIEHGLAEIDERRGLLDRLAPTPTPIRRARAGDDVGDADGALRGPDIREVAVTLLVDNGREALHYREWYELLERAGHEIAGKDPLAVFLTQISRSPAVRRGARAGIYELDRGAFHRLRLQIDALQHELGTLPADRHPRRRRDPRPPRPPEHRDQPRRTRASKRSPASSARARRSPPRADARRRLSDH